MMPRQTPDILAGLGQGESMDDVRAAMGPQVERIATVHIRRDGGTQPRAGIDQAVVDDYHSDMQAGAVFPPVELVYDGTEYWLWDGFHRFEAWRKDGDRLITAHVRQGTRRDAVLLSVGANATHGFRRTNEDKRRAVLALLEDEEWGQWSDSEIARRCAVSQPFVGKLRSELSYNGYRMDTRRVERNGVEYDMKLPQRSAAPAVAAQGGVPFVPVDIDEQVEVEVSQTGSVGDRPEQVVVVPWRRTRGRITWDGRVLVQMHDGTKRAPWLELDDAGQHWMLDMIRRAQEVRA